MQSEVPWDSSALVAIFRGVLPERVVDVADVVYAAGFRVIEVPLNSSLQTSCGSAWARKAPKVEKKTKRRKVAGFMYLLSCRTTCR